MQLACEQAEGGGESEEEQSHKFIIIKKEQKSWQVAYNKFKSISFILLTKLNKLNTQIFLC